MSSEGSMLGASERASERARQTAEGKTGSHLNRERSRYVTLRCYGSKISGTQQIKDLQIWQK